MKKLMIVFASLLLLQFVPHKNSDKLSKIGLEEGASLPSISNKAFKVGERLQYRLHYGLVNAGIAEIQLEPSKVDVKGRELIHAVGMGYSTGMFDWFFKVRDRYETYMDKQGIFPWMFVRRVDEGGYLINQDYTFLQHKKQVNNGEGKFFSVPTGTQDMLSSFYRARTFDFRNAKVGDLYSMSTFVDDELWPLQFKFIGRETVKVDAGKFRCMKFVPILQTGRIFENEEDLVCYITDDANKIPVLVKAKVLVGSIKMELTGYDGLANASAKID